MASGGPVRELCEEATCSICLDYFNDPVVIAECGHSFCRACLTQNWGQVGAEPSCPHCRGSAQPKSLRTNHQLASFVGLIKKLSLQEEGEEAGAKKRVCEKHQKPLELFCMEEETPLCGLCIISKKHKGHKVVPLEEAVREYKAVVAATKGRVCQKHQEPMKLFCKVDEALICVVCDRSKEHRHHETLPLEEASQEYKDKMHNCLEILKNERERIMIYEGDILKESQDLLKQTEGEKQEMVAKFRQLHEFLDEQEKLLLAQMEEVEKEVAKERDQHLARLSEALSPLKSLIQEMEEKCEQPGGDLLQDIKSTLQRYEEKEPFENPVTFPHALKWKIWDFCDINHLLEGVTKQLKDTLNSGLHLQEANVTLDPATAHPQLIVLDDQKNVRLGETAQALTTNPERFDRFAVVLGCEVFTAGRHFWEVLVESEEGWMVGVARKSVNRKGNITFCPEEGFWQVGKWNGGYGASLKDHYPPLNLNGELKRIRIYLNYVGGRVAFFDGDQAVLLYEFSETSFSGETLLPSFWVNLKAHLQLC